MVDIAETVVENKMLINRIDEILGQDYSADNGPRYDQISATESIGQSQSLAIQGLIESHRSARRKMDELDEFSDSFVNKLYEEIVGDGKTSRESREAIESSLDEKFGIRKTHKPIYSAQKHPRPSTAKLVSNKKCKPSNQKFKP